MAQTPQPAARTRPAAATSPSRPALAVKYSVLRVFGLALITFSLYFIYWFYVARKQAFEELGEDGSAGLHTFVAIIPIVNLIVYYLLVRDISRLQAKAGLPQYSPVLYFIGFLLPLVGYVVYGLVISKLNEYWDKSSGARATDAPVTGGQIAIIVVGLLLGTFYLIAIVAAVVSGAKETSDKAKDPVYRQQIEQDARGAVDAPPRKDNSASSDEVYAKIQNGMTKEEVEAIAGKAGRCSQSETSRLGITELCSFGKSSDISVVIQKGVVTSKSKF